MINRDKVRHVHATAISAADISETLKREKQQFENRMQML
jgi:hypothetical protein